ncbi:hypothetical protein BDZ89DRAFT_1055058 [Hymenopellis radicata]|nr:hypothetical protein BDZ89DRAFT_1055058 [Hymenopellis radicata]
MATATATETKRTRTSMTLSIARTVWVFGVQEESLLCRLETGINELPPPGRRGLVSGRRFIIGLFGSHSVSDQGSSGSGKGVGTASSRGDEGKVVGQASGVLGSARSLSLGKGGL